LLFLFLLLEGNVWVNGFLKDGLDTFGSASFRALEVNDAEFRELAAEFGFGI
jgi:hypothetical protein